MRAPNRVAIGRIAARTRFAIAWLCALRSPLSTRFTWMSATFEPLAAGSSGARAR